MIDAGVIMCCSAGNTNQKLVGAMHPDYNNYSIHKMMLQH